ncbi:hypothetical protein [uncultured Roseobacter sp.]|uniref:hypothetical protein n=1 Tax=uncultured Roseobacter sp. TaxID=114847 RepID=UPI00262D924E|nr:hypothetical protein [uncultured Roseobacter sp.]
MPVIFHRSRPVLGLAATLSLCLLAGPTLAANANATGVDASFATLSTDFNALLQGNLMNALMIGGLIGSIAVWIFTSRMGWALGVIGASVFAGYGLPALSGLGGFSATVDMLNGPLVEITAEVAAPAETTALAALASTADVIGG